VEPGGNGPGDAGAHRKNPQKGGKWVIFAAALLFLTLSATAAGAQSAEPPSARGSISVQPPPPVAPAVVSRDGDGRVTVRATRLTGTLDVDGRLEESIYQEIESVSDFVQQDPREGAPATERTEVWVLFDDRNLYVAARCWDSQPEKMVANELRRDHGNIFNNDNFAVALDTFYDRRNGFLFQTNPVGGVGDGYMTDEKEHNRDWSTVWETKSRKFDKGWTVEMAIPFKSLRYTAAGPQTWGLLLRRIVRGSGNEHSFITQIPAAAAGGGIYRMSRAATLVGVDAPARSRNLEIKPYAISTNLTDNVSRPAISNDLTGDWGVDVKYGLTRSLIADFTYNTDFAQVEDDAQQVNLTRFSLFFPEKREFFLEGQGIFAFGGVSGQTGRGLGSTIPTESPVMFFSRRIGLNGGLSVPIIAGGRLTGRAGKYSIGALNIETDELAAARAAQTNFSVFRVKRDFLRRSNVGVIMTRRSPLTTPSPALGAGGVNLVGGVDLNLSFYQALNILGYYARSDTPGRGGDDYSYRGAFDYAGDRYGLQFEQMMVGNDFNPEVGFLRRSDFRRSYAAARFSPRPANSKVFRKVGVEGSFDYIANARSGDVETRQATAGTNIEFNSGDRWQLDYSQSFEAITERFTVAGQGVVQPGAYEFQDISTSYTLGPRRKVAGTLRVLRGSFYDGDQTSASYTGRIELNPKFSIEPNISFNWIDLPGGAFTARLLSNRANITFTPRMALGALVQYNSSNNSLGTNIRFRWEYTPGSDFYVVYSEGRNTVVDLPGALSNRAFSIKLTRLFRF
jgi:hypothetical protein